MATTKYAMIDETKTEMYVELFDREAEAIDEAIRLWDHLTQAERKDRDVRVAEIELDANEWDGIEHRIIWKPGMFQVRDCESGNVLEVCDTLTEAEDTVRRFESSDREDGVYTPDFYEIYDTVLEEVRA